MKVRSDIVLLLLAVSSAARCLASDLPLNDKVLDYCKSKLDKPKVGNGQCAALAALALKTAGAKERAGPDAPQPRDYVWGKQVYAIDAAPGGPKEIGELSDVRPGDIVQYRDTVFITARFAHHTSVVNEVDVSAKKLKVIQQNVGGKEVVVEGLVQLNKLHEGYIRIYRPIKEGK